MTTNHYIEGLTKCSACLSQAMESIKNYEEEHHLASLYLLRLELLKELIDGAILIEQETEKRIHRTPKL